MTDEDVKKHKKANKCCICGKCFGKVVKHKKNGGSYETEDKVRDHDHATGKYRGAAHEKCNINYFSNRYLPVVFHNLRGYDSHFIIKKAYDIMNQLDKYEVKMSGKEKRVRFSVIPNSNEKFMSLNVGHLKFIDSFQFMASSLESLVDNLIEKKQDDKYINFPCMKQVFGHDIDVLCQKGFYPYEWFDSIDKFSHDGLPPINDFYSQLSQKHISENNYKHAQKVYSQLGCKTFKDYHMTYLKCDVLLLADVFENFRKTCIEYYDGLDPANYISAPSLAWDALLKKTGVELDLISDDKNIRYY